MLVMGNIVHVQNKSVYEDKNIVSEYAEKSHITASEETILDFLRKELPKMEMLDIAVGGGRTTVHFSDCVKKYVGVDYSAEMIAACESRFSGHPDNMSFAVADMRSMDMFENNSFDFVFISNNAISTLTHNDRLKALQEIHRIGRPGGYFYFSAHNLQWVYRVMFNLRRQIFWSHPKTTYWQLKKWVRAHKHNDMSVIRKIRKLPHAIVSDSAHDFRLKHYYITPNEQIKQLATYFDNVRVIGRDGQEIFNEKKLAINDDGFLYYLCTFRRH
jgi:ubiquinone/menaquinone biosynthesis C-methylase UbiE